MTEKKKYIAHLDLDSFFVSVERVKNPSLIGKPVIVGGRPGGRGVVASASYEARKYGVHSAMPTAQALKLCPHLIIVSGHHGEYADYSDRVFKRLLDFAPVAERASIDEVYMDFTGCEAVYRNDLPGLMKTLQQLIKDEFGLPCTISLASNKTIAKVATDGAKPNGVISVPHGAEMEFLAPLSIDVLPGVGKKTSEVLKGKGFFKISDLQRASRGRLIELLGAYGGYLFDAASGIGADSIETEWTRKSISREETFPHDIADTRRLEEILFTLVESVCGTLRAHHWKARTVTLKLRYSSFKTITCRQTLEPLNYDPEVFTAARELLRKAYDKGKPVRLIGVGLSQFVDEAQTELPLFPSSPHRRKVLDAVDRLRQKFGDDVIHLGKV
ncbi:MAG: DNA polymerase IV [Ignavibacteriales bacterium CG07_land_8_20_14_0_80_59_12]|nr:MAG: DNA polymerase IV [Ignavibacteriales bacterium CG07_land_8_20_14_0_80_59_12]